MPLRILLQENDNGLLQPIALISCTLTDTERRCTQSKKECLSICNTFSKYHDWLYVHPNIQVYRDHKQLEIFVKKAINQAPARIQRMLLRLQKY